VSVHLLFQAANHDGELRQVRAAVGRHVPGSRKPRIPAHTWIMGDALVFWFPFIVLAAAIVVWAYGLVDFAGTDERQIRTFTRPVWLVILIFGNALGAIAWLMAGRPVRPSSPRRN
jgi:hypothetical protein